MVTSTAARVTWLLAEPETRECHTIASAKAAAGQREPFGECLYCHAPVSPFGNGTKRAMQASVRDRGTEWQNKETLYIHKGCIPPPGNWKPQRIPARALHASQVRATTDKGET